jgi:chaperonin cofactor prefoldin
LPSLDKRVEALEAQVESLTQQVQALREDLNNHTHTYLTGEGVGQNAVEAHTGAAEF